MFKERGVRKIAPQRMVWAIRKVDLYELAERQKWPKPYAPFMIQVRIHQDIFCVLIEVFCLLY